MNDNFEFLVKEYMILKLYSKLGINTIDTIEDFMNRLSNEHRKLLNACISLGYC